jgi:hypothetical protein
LAVAAAWPFGDAAVAFPEGAGMLNKPRFFPYRQFVLWL